MRRWLLDTGRSPTAAATSTINTAHTLVQTYDLIVVEDLTIATMVRRAQPIPDPECTGEPLPARPAQQPRPG